MFLVPSYCLPSVFFFYSLERVLRLPEFSLLEFHIYFPGVPTERERSHTARHTAAHLGVRQEGRSPSLTEAGPLRRHVILDPGPGS